MERKGFHLFPEDRANNPMTTLPAARWRAVIKEHLGNCRTKIAPRSRNTSKSLPPVDGPPRAGPRTAKGGDKS